MNVALQQHLAPIKPYLDDNSISEILINGPGRLTIERMGEFEDIDTPIDYSFLMRLGGLIAAFNKKTLSESSPRLSGVLPQGFRVQIVIPPVLPKNQFALSIRKQVATNMRLEDFGNDFYKYATINGEQGDALAFLKQAVQTKKTIVVSGATSSGKTTFLNACLKEIPLHERLVILEDTQELIVPHKNHTRLMAGYFDEANIEQDMIKNLQASLRLRPDRILLGELRGGEAATFLQAISTGHEGSLTTIHASSPEGAIKRLIWLIQSGGTNLSFEVLKEQVQSVVDVVVQLGRDSKMRYISKIESNLVWPDQKN